MAQIYRWIAPDGKSKKKGCGKIQVRVVEYTIDAAGTPQTYRLITSLMDMALFPALLLAAEYHQRWEIENTIDEPEAERLRLRSKLISTGAKLSSVLLNPVKLSKKFMAGFWDTMQYGV